LLKGDVGDYELIVVFHNLSIYSKSKIIQVLIAWRSSGSSSS